MIRLNREEFRVWMEAQPEREYIGIRRAFSSCPVANYLAARGVIAPIVQVVGYGTREYGVLTPDWARTFIVRLDGGKGTRVRRETALRILDSIPNETNNRKECT